MNNILYYVHDPMCSWCWGFSKTLEELLENLPASITVQRILGGLATDTNLPMPDEMQQLIKNNWLRIEETIPGVTFNFDFWTKNTARRSTYPACRAVIAARKQGQEYDILMTKAIQQAYYKQARNPSDESILIELASELKLSVEDFKNDLTSDTTQKQLGKEINLARELYVESYPSLVLATGNSVSPINIDYNNSNIMLDEIKKKIRS